MVSIKEMISIKKSMYVASTTLYVDCAIYIYINGLLHDVLCTALFYHFFTCKKSKNEIKRNKREYIYTHTYIDIYLYVCVCVCYLRQCARAHTCSDEHKQEFIMFICTVSLNVIYQTMYGKKASNTIAVDHNCYKAMSF